MDKLKKSQFILVLIICYLFIFTIISLTLLLNNVYNVVGIEGFVSWLVIVIFIFLLFLYFVFKSRQFRIIFSLILTLISGGGLAMLLVMQTYSLGEFILLLVLAGLLILSIVLFVVKDNVSLKKRGFLLAFSIIGYIVLFIIFFQKPFFLTILQFIILFPFSLVACLNSTQTYSKKTKLKRPINKYIKIGIILLPMLSASVLLFSERTLEIDPKNSPEIIFWTDTSAIPTDETTLQDMYQNDIGFCVVLRDYGRYLSSSAKLKIEYLLNHSIITYICLGGEDGEFYLTTDNADTFPDIYKNIRNWLINNNLFNYPSLRGFVVDAETPKDLLEDFGDKSFSEKTNYMVTHLPTQRELDRAEDSLNEMIDLIHDSGKKMGIIKLPSSMDELDNDGDYSTLSRNIYSLDLDWDFSISMNYRTQHKPTLFDYMIQDMNEYSYTSDYELDYLDDDELERSTVPLSTFYYDVSFELNSKELNIRRDNRYIFIGNFDKKFSETSYIKDKEYQKDLDICDHLGVKQVWMYEYRTWKSHYSLDDLIEHNEDSDKWVLVVPMYMFSREICLSLVSAIADRFLYVY